MSRSAKKSTQRDQWPLAFRSREGVRILRSCWTTVTEMTPNKDQKKEFFKIGEQAMQEIGNAAKFQLQKTGDADPLLNALSWTMPMKPRTMYGQDNHVAARYSLVAAYMDKIYWSDPEPHRLLNLAAGLFSLCSGEEVVLEVLTSDDILILGAIDVCHPALAAKTFECVAITLRELARMHLRLFGTENGYPTILRSLVVPAMPSGARVGRTDIHLMSEQAAALALLDAKRTQLIAIHNDPESNLIELAHVALNMVLIVVAGTNVPVPKHLMPQQYLDQLFNGAQQALDAICDGVDDCLMEEDANSFELPTYGMDLHGEEPPPEHVWPNGPDDVYIHRRRKWAAEDYLRELYQFRPAEFPGKRKKVMPALDVLNCIATAGEVLIESTKDDGQLRKIVLPPFIPHEMSARWTLELVGYARCALVNVAQHVMYYFDGRQIKLWDKNVPRVPLARVPGMLPESKVVTSN